MEETQSPLGILGILREAFKSTIRNGKLVLSIAFFMFIYYYLLEFADHLILAPVLSDFVSKYALKPKELNLNEIDPKLYKAILKDMRCILLFGLIILAVSSLILLTSLSAVIHSTNEAYTAKVLSFKDMLLSIRARWKRPFITTITLVLFSSAIGVLFLIVLGLAVIMTDGYLLNFLLGGLIFSGACFCIYLSAVWILSLVVSVLEENSSGMKAVDRARDLMKGRTVKGCFLMLILILASLAVSEAFALLGRNTANCTLIWMAISVPRIWLFCLKKLFLFIVFTIFYHECQRSHPAEDKSRVYIPISIVEP